MNIRVCQPTEDKPGHVMEMTFEEYILLYVVGEPAVPRIAAAHVVSATFRAFPCVGCGELVEDTDKVYVITSPNKEAPYCRECFGLIEANCGEPTEVFPNFQPYREELRRLQEFYNMVVEIGKRALEDEESPDA